MSYCRGCRRIWTKAKIPWVGAATWTNDDSPSPFLPVPAGDKWEIIMKSSMNHRYFSSQTTGSILCSFFLFFLILFYRGFSNVNPAEASGLETNVYSLQVSSYVDVYLNRYIYNNLHIQAHRHRHTPRHRQA